MTDWQPHQWPNFNQQSSIPSAYSGGQVGVGGLQQPISLLEQQSYAILNRINAIENKLDELIKLLKVQVD